MLVMLVMFSHSRSLSLSLSLCTNTGLYRDMYALESACALRAHLILFFAYLPSTYKISANLFNTRKARIDIYASQRVLKKEVTHTRQKPSRNTNWASQRLPRDLVKQITATSRTSPDTNATKRPKKSPSPLNLQGSAHKTGFTEKPKVVIPRRASSINT